MCHFIGIEAQLLSKADIERGVNVTFPMQNNNISVQSEVPSSTISKQTFWICEANSTKLSQLQKCFLDQLQTHF